MAYCFSVNLLLSITRLSSKLTGALKYKYHQFSTNNANKYIKEP